MNDYTNNKLTWQAHWVMTINQKCIDTGHYPNGQKVNPKDIDNLKTEISNCKRLLINNGCIDNQLKLF